MNAVVFTDPEIGTAGLQEHEAKAAGHEVKIGKMPYSAIGRAMTTVAAEGFQKVILDANDNRTGDHHRWCERIRLDPEAALAVEPDRSIGYWFNHSSASNTR